MIATNQTEMKRKKEEKTEKKKEELIDLEENEEEGLYNFKPPKKIHFQVAPDIQATCWKNTAGNRAGKPRRA